MKSEIKMPQGVTASLAGATLTVKGPKGEVKRLFNNPKSSVSVEGDKIVLNAEGSNRSDKCILGTYDSHVRNMITGVTKGYTYKLIVAQTHFPIRVKADGNKIIVIENFIGERKQRMARIMPGVKVSINGADIVVESVDKEAAGQTAANIEIASKISGKDRRTFGDGIYILKGAE